VKKKLSNFLKLSFLLLFVSTYVTGFAQGNLQPDSILHIMKKTADWQWEDLEQNGWKTPKTDWTNAAMYTGMMAFGKVANDNVYYKKLIEVGEENKWGLGPEIYFADDYCVGQTYAQLYQLYKNPKYIAKFKDRADTIVTLPHTESLLWVNEIYNREWAWCDALYMGPPALGYLTEATGDMKYLNTASKLWWKSSDWLYDKEEHLFFRDSRYFDKKEKNGTKVFWSRGNGWVMGGLVRVLEVMPQNHLDRKRFEKQFKEMSKRIASLQQPDGSWHASLLDPESFPAKETSGTGFFAYALAWGVNNGLLNYNDYKMVINNSWTALVTSVHPNGKLGYVQAQGRDPQGVTYNDTDVYGVGAFLLAGTEMLKMELARENGLVVSAKNTLPMVRKAQTVEVSWKAIIKRNKNVDAENVVVIDVMSGKQIPTQLIYNGKKKPQTLIFQTDIAEGTELFFVVKAGTPEKFGAKVYGRQVPERFDDFAWENDKVAFRMYGAALDKEEKGNAKGIDYWAKNTPNMILNKWYKSDNYHVDNGEGMDAYHVGMTLGAGNSSVYKDGKFAFSGNYISYKFIEQGPIRLVFDLIYDSWDANGQKVSQVKTISLDAGTYINKITDRYKFDGDNSPIAIGVTKHKNDGSSKIDNINNYVSYWDKADGKVDNGMIGVAVLFQAAENIKLVDEADHLLGIKTIMKDQTFTYYQGGGWNRGGVYSTETEWLKYLENYSKGLNTPILVKY
jgi:rhamnogalacturonyl hydrolase YesR